MFRLFLKNKKGQNTAEYALLIALVVAAIIAMQQYAQRALQGRVRDASTYMATETGKIGASVQYEPYYQQSNYTVDRESTENKRTIGNIVGQDSISVRGRQGSQTTSYATTPTTGGNVIMPSGI